MGMRMVLWNRRFAEEFWRDLNVFVPLYAMAGGMLASFFSQIPGGGQAIDMAWTAIAAAGGVSIWGDKGLSPRRVDPSRQWLYWSSHGSLLAGNAVFAAWFWNVASTGVGSFLFAMRGEVLATVAASAWLVGLWGLWMAAKAPALSDR